MNKMKLTKKDEEDIKMFKSLPVFSKDQEFMEATPFFAKTNKDLWLTINFSNVTLCLSNYIFIKKNTLIASYDHILDVKETYKDPWGSPMVRIYIKDNNSFYITRTSFKNLNAIGVL